MYIWQRAGWPELGWRADRLLEPLAAARLVQGRLLGAMAGLGFDLKLEAQLQALTEDVVKSSAIEGEALDRAGVRSSLARRLGIAEAGTARSDRRIDGIVEMTLDATRNSAAMLTRERLLAWQAALFPTGYSGMHRIRIGAWRDDADGPMQVVSGPLGRQRVHFEAPPAQRVEVEMGRFLDWFNAAPTTDGLLRAGLAHFWFVTIHPFEDGNGRVARAIADQALAQSEGSPQRFYSMSSQIRLERSDYYRALEGAQRGTLDVTAWLEWFLGCFTRAVDASEAARAGVLRKTAFWHRHGEAGLSERQRRMLNRYLDGFEGKLTARKWASMAKVSIPTAQRDINDLIDRGILVRGPGGSKNTSYALSDE